MLVFRLVFERPDEPPGEILIGPCPDRVSALAAYNAYEAKDYFDGAKFEFYNGEEVTGWALSDGHNQDQVIPIG